MAESEDKKTTSHAPGSQPSTRPGSDEPQTITAPTPPIAWTSGAPDRSDPTDPTDGEGTEQPPTGEPPTGEKPRTTPHD
jgi:hypothetical protein